ERELATDLDERTRDRDPAAIEPRVERDERTVTRGVEDADELLTHEDRVREDDAAAEHRGKGLRDRGLAGARRPEEEDRPPAVDGGTELPERLLRKDEVRERLANLVEGDLKAADRLGTNTIHVRRERHRSRADVADLCERLASSFLALRRDDVHVRRRGHARAALDLDEVLGLEELEDALEDLGERQADDVGQLGGGGLTLLVEDLQDEVGDKGLGETGLFDRDRCDGCGSLRG